jgi:hypothetical protein
MMMPKKGNQVIQTSFQLVMLSKCLKREKRYYKNVSLIPIFIQKCISFNCKTAVDDLPGALAFGLSQAF